jgi:hypothetical protein
VKWCTAQCRLEEANPQGDTWSRVELVHRSREVGLYGSVERTLPAEYTEREVP